MSAEIIQHPAVGRRTGHPERRPSFPLKRRHVFYVPGYDPRGVRAYRRLFRDGCASLESIYGVRTMVAKAARTGGGCSYAWRAKAESADWNVDVTYEFLRWDDLARADLARPLAWKIGRGLQVYAHYLASGAIARFFGETWRFGLFTIYALLGLLAFAAAGVAAGAVAATVAAGLGAGPLVAGALAIAVGVIAARLAFLRLGRPYYVDYLLTDLVATADYAARRRPDWDARLDAFAAQVAAAAADGGLDEILIVGHSSGSFLAVDVADRAMRLDPRLGRIGPRLSLLTLGSVTPVVSFLPEAEWFRAAMARLAVSERITWLEYQARKDVMSVHRSDPIEASRVVLPVERRVNPTVVQVQLRSLLKAATYRRLRGRFFDLHFVLVGAAERPCHFDYHMTVMGPVPLALRARYGEDAFAACLPDRPGAAWERLARTAHEV